MLLLNTHIWHWWVNQIPDKLSAEYIALIEEADEIAVFTISCFEMCWLVKHGRINLNMPFKDWFSQIESSTDLKFPPITAPITMQAATSPKHHRNPQDRIIIATALHFDARLISFDKVILCLPGTSGSFAWK